MRGKPVIVGTLTLGCVALSAAILTAAQPREGREQRQINAAAALEAASSRAAVKQHRSALRTGSTSGATASAGETPLPAQTRIVSIPVADIQRFGGGGVSGGVAPGTTVYNNDIPEATDAYTPGAGQRMADDLQLASGACDVVYYEIVVVGFNTSGEEGETFDVQTALWDGDPCTTGSVIPGTEAEFLGVPNDGSGQALSATLAAPVTVPGTVWLAVTFTSDDGGWIIAEAAELGQTGDLFSEDDDANTCTDVSQCPNGYACTEGICQACGLFFFLGDPLAGFWTTVNCELASDPTGACCEKTSCSEQTEADCTAAGGTWLGAFTTCTPNPCLTGACCTGSNFQSCSDGSQADCTDGLFHPGGTCADTPCGPTYRGYANTFNTGTFAGVSTGQRWADDMVMSNVPTVAGGTVPCELAGYDVLVTGDGTQGPEAFDVTVELWTNSPGDNPDTPLDDRPLVAIPGTEASFTGVQADFFLHRLVAGEFEGIVLPDKVWLVMTTNTQFAGPLLGGFPAKLGVGEDAFAIFNSEASPNQWFGGFAFCVDPNQPETCGFDPTGCPTEGTCVPAGSFRMNLWCHGDRPRGACCDDGTGTCVDDVTALECEGRFLAGVTCDSDAFAPVCGTNACCFPNPVNPDTTVCQDLTLDACEEMEGAAADGLTCGEVACPSVDCIGRSGSCFEDNARPGCDDAFCCETVCTSPGGDFCCTTRWDGVCAQDAEELCDAPPANDTPESAETISGEGTFAFDNAGAGASGPDNAACTSIDNITPITNDVWFCWTPSCTDTATVSTCSQTTVDTKLAVYEDCTQPPSDLSLLSCNDDICGFQTQASFQAIEGQTYLIRVGTFPGMEGGPGEFTVRCGPEDNPACPGSVDCCTGTSMAEESPGCADETCCERVCACDSFCCETDWDVSCATTGFNDNGCGAAALCAPLCGTCPTGTISWLDPPNGVVDAAFPVDPASGAALGIQTITMRGPTGAHEGCFSMCDTAGSGNAIASVVEDLGIYTITLTEPIAPNAVTIVTYTDALGDTFPAQFISHPGNTNGDEVTDLNDIMSLTEFLSGTTTAAPWGLFGADLDRDGSGVSADLLAEIDMLLGVGMLEPALNSPRPSTGNGCPP